MKLLNRLTLSATALCATALLASAPAQAAYVVNMVQSGSDVVATGSGSLDTSGLTLWGPEPAPPGMVSGEGALVLGAESLMDVFGLPSGHIFGGSSVFIYAQSGDGPTVGITRFVLGVPTGYTSGSALGTSTARWNNRTFANLSLTPGSYVWSWGSGANADTYTLNIGPGAPGVPEPATWASMLLGLGLTGFAIRRRPRRSRRVAAA
jgi:hypothetical protein